MVRAPCCEKMGLKRGPWTAEEDKILITYIQEYGHGNWRALPKQAGLLRCGKSCRLRWTNYLRPDIKRGNFSKDEEETIIKLHEMLGNRWSTIAARLPGRTDNEIKNVWHTHLKKRLKQTTSTRETKKQQPIEAPKQEPEIMTETKPESTSANVQESENSGNSPVSPQPSSSGFSSGMESSIVTGENQEMGIKDEYMESSETFPKIDESFWLQAWPTDSNFGTVEDLNEISTEPRNQQLPESTTSTNTTMAMAEDMDFWYNLFMGAGELTELPEL